MDVKARESAAGENAVARRKAPDFTDQLFEPFAQLRGEVDRLFEGFPFRLPTFWSSRYSVGPALEMSQTDKSYKITAELPGIDPDNVEVTFADGLLRIAGEKIDERDEKESGYRFSERRYGSFERLIELPASADETSIDAKFKDGVLTLTIDKNGEEKRNLRRIKVKRT